MPYHAFLAAARALTSVGLIADTRSMPDPWSPPIGPSAVLGRNVCDGKWPGDRKGRIVVADARGGGRGVEGRDQVDHLGIGKQGLKSVREADRYVELAAIARRLAYNLPSANT